eukprot:322077_1
MNETWPIPEKKTQEIEAGSIMDKPQSTIRQKSMNQGVENLEKQKKNNEKKTNETYDKMDAMINDTTYDNMNTNETYDNDGVEYVEMTEIKQEMKDDILNKDKSVSPEFSCSNDEEDDEDNSSHSSEEPEPSNNIDIAVVDPFIARDLEVEIYEVINSFDMLKYGEHMARFVIRQIEDFSMDESWVVLGIVMEALPFKLALEILYDEMAILRRGQTKQLQEICHHMVDGTNWTISAALRMSEYFDAIAKEDEFQEEEWEKISETFEGIAHKSVNEIESDHLLYTLLTIPLYDTQEPMNIMKLALEQKRISFLNNERILDVVTHTWNHGPSIDIEESIKSEDLSSSQLLPRLVFYPFRFYMSPVGYNYTLSILFLLYLLYVLGYSWYIVRGEDTQIGYIADSILWILNIGYVSYEFSEFSDKGREYFSVSGLMNIWDIMISIVWVALFLVNVVFLQAFHLKPSEHVNLREIIDDAREEGHTKFFVKTYTFLFGLQLFLLSTRFLTLFQNTEYLGGMLKVVQMMFGQIVKFFSVVAVTI